MTRYPDDIDADAHPTQETRRLNGVDQRLRRAGYEIHRRVTGQAVLWRHKRSGAIETQAQALAAVKAAWAEMRAAKEGPE